MPSLRNTVGVEEGRRWSILRLRSYEKPSRGPGSTILEYNKLINCPPARWRTCFTVRACVLSFVRLSCANPIGTRGIRRKPMTHFRGGAAFVHPSFRSFHAHTVLGMSASIASCLVIATVHRSTAIDATKSPLKVHRAHSPPALAPRTSHHRSYGFSWNWRAGNPHCHRCKLRNPPERGPQS